MTQGPPPPPRPKVTPQTIQGMAPMRKQTVTMTEEEHANLMTALDEWKEWKAKESSPSRSEFEVTLKDVQTLMTQGQRLENLVNSVLKGQASEAEERERRAQEGRDAAIDRDSRHKLYLTIAGAVLTAVVTLATALINRAFPTAPILQPAILTQPLPGVHS